MIIDLLMLPIVSIVRGILFLLPNVSPLSTGITEVFSYIGNAISYAGIIFPVEAIRVCGASLIYAYSIYIAIILYTWVANFAPWLKPFARQHIVTSDQTTTMNGKTYHRVRTFNTSRR